VLARQLSHGQHMYQSAQEQHCASGDVNLRKRKRSVQDEADRPQSDQRTQKGLDVLAAGQIGEVAVAGVGLAAGYHRYSHLDSCWQLQGH